MRAVGDLLMVGCPKDRALLSPKGLAGSCRAPHPGVGTCGGVHPGNILVVILSEHSRDDLLTYCLREALHNPTTRCDA